MLLNYETQYQLNISAADIQISCAAALESKGEFLAAVLSMSNLTLIAFKTMKKFYNSLHPSMCCDYTFHSIAFCTFELFSVIYVKKSMFCCFFLFDVYQICMFTMICCFSQ